MKGKKNRFESAEDLLNSLTLSPKGTCIECNRALNSTGYPAISFSGKVWKISRLLLFLQHGDLKGKEVIHTCDNPRCINPSHLRLASHQENMEDASDKGRMAHGENHPNAKLKEKDVRTIYDLYFNGKESLAISSETGIPQSTICSIIAGRSWYLTSKKILAACPAQ